MKWILAFFAALALSPVFSLVPSGWARINSFFAQRKKREADHELLRLMAGWLRSGMSLEEVWDLLLKEEERGFQGKIPGVVSTSASWMPIEARFQELFGHNDWALVGSVIQLGYESGGKLADALEVCAKIMRQKALLRKRIRMLTAEGTLSAWIVGLSPFGFMALLAFFAPDLVKPLFITKPGWCLLGMAGLLSGAGLFMVHRIAKIDL